MVTLNIARLGANSSRAPLLTRAPHMLKSSRAERPGPISWRFRQPRLALFWFRKGLKELHLELDGRRIHSGIKQAASLAPLPALTSVEGKFDVAPSFDYTWSSLTRLLRATPAATSIGR